MAAPQVGDKLDEFYQRLRERVRTGSLASCVEYLRYVLKDYNICLGLREDHIVAIEVYKSAKPPRVVVQTYTTGGAVYTVLAGRRAKDGNLWFRFYVGRRRVRGY